MKKIAVTIAGCAWLRYNEFLPYLRGECDILLIV